MIVNFPKKYEFIAAGNFLAKIHFYRFRDEFCVRHIISPCCIIFSTLFDVYAPFALKPVYSSDKLTISASNSLSSFLLIVGGPPSFYVASSSCMSVDKVEEGEEKLRFAA